MPENKAFTLVFYARLNDTDISVPLYPRERDEEVNRCKSETARREKYLVWKILEKVVESRLSLNFANLQFTKTPNGKWICPNFHFSLSHTDGLVCVAVSDREVGVDIETVHNINEGLKGRILTEKEILYFNGLDTSDRQRFLLESWVKKESIFKRSGGKMLMPNGIETSEHHTELVYVDFDGSSYVISVCDGTDIKKEFTYMEEI